jgi:hypothetical protein
MILVKTEAGHQALKDRSVRLTPRQRSAFILFDGKRSVNEVLSSGMGIAAEDIDQMVQLGLLGQVGGADPAANSATVLPSGPAPLAPAASVPPPVVTEPAAPAPVKSGDTRTSQQRYQEAYPIATRLTASLGLRGFRLNLQVEGTGTYEDLVALAPKIRAAVGADKAADLDQALGE